MLLATIGIRLPEMIQTAEAVPDDDGFDNDLNMVDASARSNGHETLESGDTPEADDVDRPEMVTQRA